MIELKAAQLRELIPGYVIDIAEALQHAGFEAYLVGGSLRDVLLGKSPEDYDIATNAYPEEVIKIFPKSVPTGAKFGTITVIGEDASGERYDVEVTTYRSEADYAGGRWPMKVEFTKTIEEDLARRDFTINAMALNLQEFDTHAAEASVVDLLVDPFQGKRDLEAKVIRAVGVALERFKEDGLRPMRGCRLAAQLQFTIDPETFTAMQQTNDITAQVSVERMRDELMKLLLKSPKPSVGFILLKDAGILKLLIPELLEGIDVNQPEFHTDDVFTHILMTVDAAEDKIKLAALFHDIAKPRTRSQDARGVHFYGHDLLGARMTREIMTRLRFSNAEIDHTEKLVRWHMFYYPSADWRRRMQDEISVRNATKEELHKHIEESRARQERGGWTDGAIRRLIAAVGGEDAIDDLMKLRIADAGGNPKSEFNPHELDVLASRIAEVRAQDMALKLTDLDVTGEDLMQELGLVPGPKLGEVLKQLLDAVLEDPGLNTKEKLLALAKTYLSTINHERE